MDSIILMVNQTGEQDHQDILCFILKQRIKNPVNPVDPVKE